MKKGKYTYTIDIPKPCHENWNTMTPDDKGRFCAQCSKTVIDFTRMSDHQIVQLLENSSSKICGHVTTDQLNRRISSVEPVFQRTFYPLPYLLSGLLLLSLPSCNFAQEQETDPEQPHLILGEIVRHPEDQTSNHMIKGTVFDSLTSEVLPNIKLRVFDDTVIIASAYTDTDGNFKLDLPNTLNKSLRLVILSPYNGYEEKIIAINTATDFPWNKKIYLTSQPATLQGEVIYTKQPYVKHPKRK